MWIILAARADLAMASGQSHAFALFCDPRQRHGFSIRHSDAISNAKAIFSCREQ
jgi:hypothetical protein